MKNRILHSSGAQANRLERKNISKPFTHWIFSESSRFVRAVSTKTKKVIRRNTRSKRMKHKKSEVAALRSISPWVNCFQINKKKQWKSLYFLLAELVHASRSNSGISRKFHRWSLSHSKFTTLHWKTRLISRQLDNCGQFALDVSTKTVIFKSQTRKLKNPFPVGCFGFSPARNFIVYALKRVFCSPPNHYIKGYKCQGKSAERGWWISEQFRSPCR